MSRVFTVHRKAGFFGRDFPVSECVLSGGIRHHVHEYPHTPGGDTEPMGRKLYTIRMKAFFLDVPGSKLNKEFPDLYPTTLQILRTAFEEEKVADLLIPTVGTIKARAVNWTQTMSSGNLSGENVDLEFLEEYESQYLDKSGSVDINLDVGAANDALQLAVSTKLAELDDGEFGNVDPRIDKATSLFQAINDAVGAVLAIRDTVDIAARLIEAKILKVADLCREVDRTLGTLQGADFVRIMQANRDLWQSVNETLENVTQKPSAIQFYETPKLMGINEVAVVLARYDVKATDLLNLNGFEDAFAIPPGTRVKYLNLAA
jgi:prophage DNA circulation protein